MMRTWPYGEIAVAQERKLLSPQVVVKGTTLKPSLGRRIGLDYADNLKYHSGSYQYPRLMRCSGRALISVPPELKKSLGIQGGRGKEAGSPSYTRALLVSAELDGDRSYDMRDGRVLGHRQPRRQ